MWPKASEQCSADGVMGFDGGARPVGGEEIKKPLGLVFRREGGHVVKLEGRLVALGKERVHPVPGKAREKGGGGVSGDIRFRLGVRCVDVGR